MSPQETVTAWSALDDARIYRLLAENLVYHNILLAPVTGLAAVRAHRAAWPVDQCDGELITMAAHGDVVPTARIDRSRHGADWIV